jgi:hypothetical protein
MVASLLSQSAAGKLTVSWVLAVAIASSLLSGVDAFGADEQKAVEVAGDERIAFLRFLAARNQANYQKIETWRGKYSSIERFPQKLQLAPKPGKPAEEEADSPPEIQGNRIKTTSALFARGVDLVKGPAKDALGERNANPEVMDAGPQPVATVCFAL